MCFSSFVRNSSDLGRLVVCRASSPSRLATLRGLFYGFVALQVRVGNTHERHQNGDEHQRENNGSLHRLSLPSLSFLGRAAARGPVLRVLAELLRRSHAIVLVHRGHGRPSWNERAVPETNRRSQRLARSWRMIARPNTKNSAAAARPIQAIGSRVAR